MVHLMTFLLSFTLIMLLIFQLLVFKPFKFLPSLFDDAYIFLRFIAFYSHAVPIRRLSKHQGPPVPSCQFLLLFAFFVFMIIFYLYHFFWALLKLVNYLLVIHLSLLLLCMFYLIKDYHFPYSTYIQKTQYIHLFSYLLS